MMTKQDYELIAATIRAHCPRSGRVKLAVAFCQRLTADNPRFDAVKFMQSATSLTYVEAGRVLTLADVPINVNV